jgi:hypothetical protein
MKETSNIGKSGVDSIRIGGMIMDDLPMAEAAQAKEELPKFIEQERIQNIANIKAEYPKQSVEYLNACINESEDNVRRVSEMRGKETGLINEYTSIISLCEFRDRKLSETTNTDEIKQLKKDFPPYNVGAMQQQIIQSTESINRADTVIAKEYTDIAQYRELIGLCHQRDKKLKELEK